MSLFLFPFLSLLRLLQVVHMTGLTTDIAMSDIVITYRYDAGNSATKSLPLVVRGVTAEWTFFAISIRNLTSTQFIQNLTSDQKTKITVFTNLGRNSELSDFPICFYNQDALFQAIEYNYASTNLQKFLAFDLFLFRRIDTTKTWRSSDILRFVQCSCLHSL